MLDFGKFCYLHVEKTGGTYISGILNEISLLPIVNRSLHGTVSQRSYMDYILSRGRAERGSHGLNVRKHCFYFNSVRNPFDYYASLYNYGCDGRGGVAKALKLHGKDDFYDRTETGFLKWADFILDAQSAEIWHSEYSQACAKSVGLLTYRFLRLSLTNPLKKLKLIEKPKDAIPVYEKHNILRYTVRTEKLNNDLQYLFQGPLRSYVDLTLSDRILAKNKKVNASVSHVVTGETLRNSSLAEKVVERDAFILNKFYR
jgi:hypothetical protein